MLTGKQLRLLRQARGLMQKELADRMEIAQQRLSALEKTKRKITEQSAIKALTALSFSNEEAFLFLNTLPQSASGGGGEL
jgi:transcriptional regulator with XRE-family HTH domain